MVDTSKRYDVYCLEGNQDQVVVYRNVLFKGAKTLFPEAGSLGYREFLEIEQADGQTVFVASSSVIKFCQHGVPPTAENARQPL